MGFTDILFSRQRYESLPTAQVASPALLPGECVRLSATAYAWLTATTDTGLGLTATAVNDGSHDVCLQFGLLLTHP